MFTQHELEQLALLPPRTIALCASRAALDSLSYEHALRYEVLPLYIDHYRQERLCCITNRELTAQDHSALRFITNYPIIPVIINHSNLKESIFCAYHHNKEPVLSSFVQNNPPQSKNELLAYDWKPSSSEPSCFLSELIEYALSQRASDLHLVPTRDGITIRMRKNGELLSRYEKVSRAFTEELSRRARALCKISSSTLDGAFNIPILGIDACARASFLPTIHGEKVVLRLSMPPQQRLLKDLGLHPAIYSALESFCIAPEGILLIGGTTGSGKTTSLYTLAQHLANKGLSVSSIEDPVEQEVGGVSQTAVGSLSYEESLKILMRQDPDAIMVGELRDGASLSLCLKGATTGHLMLSSLHARDLFSMVRRLFDLGATSQDLLHAQPRLLHQELIPRLCAQCRIIHLESSGFHAPGCSRCDYSGKDGAVLISRYFEFSKALSSLPESVVEPNNLHKFGTLTGDGEEQVEEYIKNGTISRIQ